MWFLPQWYTKQWWTLNSTTNDCTVEELEKALEGYMILAYQFFGQDDQTILHTNITVKQWKEKLNVELDMRSFEQSDYSAYSYDAVWSYALAMDKMVRSNRSMVNDLRDPASIETFVGMLRETEFYGASGMLSFRNSQSRLSDMIISQFSKSNFTEVGKFYVNRDNISHSKLVTNENNYRWPCGRPVDRPPYCNIEGVRVLFNLDDCTQALTLVALSSSLSFVLLLFICFGAYFNRMSNKIKQQKKLWDTCNILGRFSGFEIPRHLIVVNRQLGSGNFGNIYGGECSFDDGCNWVSFGSMDYYWKCLQSCIRNIFNLSKS